MLRATQFPHNLPNRSDATGLSFGRFLFRVRDLLGARQIAALTALLLFTGCAPRRAQAQFIGYTSPQSNQQTLATAAACTGAQQNFLVNNFGQISHIAQLTAIGANVSSLNMMLQGSSDGVTFVPISDSWTGLNLAGFGSTGGISAQGYFAVVRVQVTCSPVAANSNFSLSYSGVAGGLYPPGGSFLQRSVEKDIYIGSAGTSSNLLAAVSTPFGSSAGQLLVFSGAGLPAGSTATVKCGDLSLSNTNVNITFALGTGTSLQVFPVPAAPCVAYAIQYISGGASGSSVTVEYLFSAPGFLQGTSAPSLTAPLNASALAEKGPRWTQLSAPAAGTQSTTSKAAGTNNTRHVADCVSYSAGAIAAPAATTLTINLRDGASGGGTVIWTKTVTIPATAAPHYDQNFCGLNLIGTANTAMTLEFSAALANESQSVTLTGYDVQ